MPKERWKPCPGYEKWYDVSNFGNVRSYHLNNNTGMADRGIEPKIMAPQIRIYIYVGLSMGIGFVKPIGVHILVAKAFIKNPHSRRCVHHKDNDKLNPSVWNLEWVTHGQNQKYAYADGVRRKPNGRLNGRCKLNENQVMEIFRSRENFYKLCAIFKISKRVVGDIKSGKLWSSVTGKKYNKKETNILQLSEKQVLEIAKSTLTQNEIAGKYNILQPRVSSIKTGRTHSEITGIKFNGIKQYFYFGVQA